MVSTEMARCIAKITGDGCLCQNYIRYNNHCRELLEEFVNAIQTEFCHSSFTYGAGNSGTPFVQIHGKKIISTFLEFLPSYRSGDVYVPPKIFDASREAKKAYLRALFDDEGSVCIRIFAKTGEWKRNLKIDSKSLRLLEGIKVLLSEFKVSTNEIRNCTKKDKRWYYLGISGHKNFVNFNNEIGFTHPLKQQKLSFLLQTYTKTIIRNNKEFLLLENELKKLLKPRKAAQQYPIQYQKCEQLSHFPA